MPRFRLRPGHYVSGGTVDGREIPLAGGNVTADVVRVGQTVRRPHPPGPGDRVYSVWDCARPPSS